MSALPGSPADRRPGRAADGGLDVALATMPSASHADGESALLVAELAARGVRAALVPWDAEDDWSRVPLVVSRSPWDYTARRGEFLAWARSVARVTRLLNPAELLVWNSHKGYLAELADAGVPVVPTTSLRAGADLAEQAGALQHAAATGADSDVVIKPAVSAGARGTLRAAAAGAEAREHLAALLREGDALVQPYLPQVEDGEVSLVLFAGVLSHAVRKLPAAGDFRVQEMHGGSVVAHEATDAERAVAAAVLAAVRWPAAYARIDLVTTGDGPLLMEAELIEPELFLPRDPAAAGRFADVLVQALAAGARG
jgi:glutathione synthase/RimK-type ligase-like ATP-grasp enzyme